MAAPSASSAVPITRPPTTVSVAQTPSAAQPMTAPASSWLATATTAASTLLLPAPWIRTGGTSWLAILEGSKQLSDLYAACTSFIADLEHIAFRRVKAEETSNPKVRCIQELVRLVQSMGNESISSLFSHDVSKTSVALCRLREGREKKGPVGLDFVVLGSESTSKKYDQFHSTADVPDELIKSCPIWSDFVGSTQTTLGEFAPPAHLNRWRLNSKFPLIYLALFRCWDGVIRGYIGQATRLSYRWNTCSSSTVNSHLSAQGLWGILTELQGGSRPTSYQLADLALAYAVAWQRSSYTDKDRKITDHVADVGGVWLFILHSYGAAVTEEELNNREALWVSMLRTDDFQRGLNQPGRTKVVATAPNSPSRDSSATVPVIVID